VEDGHVGTVQENSLLSQICRFSSPVLFSGGGGGGGGGSSSSSSSTH